MPELQEELAALLLSRLEITLVNDRAFARAPRLPMHAPTTRLILLITGRIHYHLGERDITLTQGDALLVPAWSVRRWSLDPGGRCRMAWCEFIVRPPRPGGMPAVLATFAPEVDVESIRRIGKAITAQDFLLAEGELKALLSRMLTGGTIVATPIGTRAASAEAAIEAALGWLHHHYAEAISLDELAQKAGLSPRQFRQQFMTLVGTAPRQYITALRMHEARFRLRSTDQSVKQVALAVGYTDPLYFSRHYRQYWGHAPGLRDMDQ